MNAMSENEEAEPTGPKGRLSLTSLYELFESTPEPAWLVDDVAIEAQPLIIGGAIKTLKTSVALDLAVSLATGTEFLGRFRVPKPRRVAFFSGEGARATVKETTERILRSKGVRAPDYACHFAFALPRIGRASDRAELRRILKGEAIDAVIFDPLYLCMRAGAPRARCRTCTKWAPFWPRRPKPARTRERPRSSSTTRTKALRRAAGPPRTKNSRPH